MYTHSSYIWIEANTYTHFYWNHFDSDCKIAYIKKRKFIFYLYKAAIISGRKWHDWAWHYTITLWPSNINLDIICLKCWSVLFLFNLFPLSVCLLSFIYLNKWPFSIPQLSVTFFLNRGYMLSSSSWIHQISINIISSVNQYLNLRGLDYRGHFTLYWSSYDEELCIKI